MRVAYEEQVAKKDDEHDDDDEEEEVEDDEDEEDEEAVMIAYEEQVAKAQQLVCNKAMKGVCCDPSFKNTGFSSGLLHSTGLMLDNIFL